MMAFIISAILLAYTCGVSFVTLKLFAMALKFVLKEDYEYLVEKIKAKKEGTKKND